MAETSFTLGTSQKTAKNVIYGGLSSSVQFKITQGDVRVNISSAIDDALNSYTDGDELVGDVTFTYVLISDQVTSGSIDIEYAYSYGGSYSNCTRQGSEGDATTPLAVSSGTGTSHTFVWDTATDLGDHYLGPVYLRIRGFDKVNQNGDYNSSNILKMKINNTPLAPTISSPSTSTFFKDETPEVIWAITDAVAGDAFVHFKVEMDTDSSFNSNDLKTWESRNSQHRLYFYYYDGVDWLAIPEAGIDLVSNPNYVGNNVKFIVPTEDKLSIGNWFVRVSEAEVID